MKNEHICGIIAIVGGIASKTMGGFDYIIQAMLLLMCIDIVLGFLCAWVFNTSQYAKNGVTSEALIKGAVRKISMLSLVCIGVVIDRVMNFNYVRNAVVMYFVATEGISILEHLMIMGIPVPAFVTSMLETMKKDTETNTENEIRDEEPEGKRVYKGKREA